MTEALQKNRNGKLFPWGWLKAPAGDEVAMPPIPWIWCSSACCRNTASKGANALIFADLIEQYRRYGFKWAEAMPQMESNKGVQSQWQYLESEQHRRRRC